MFGISSLDIIDCVRVVKVGVMIGRGIGIIYDTHHQQRGSRARYQDIKEPIISVLVANQGQDGRVEWMG